MLLYNSPVSGNCYKVRLLLAHLGVAYERQTVDVVDRSDRPQLLGELNPAQRVPTLVLDDGRSLAESGAILWFFGEGTRFVPDGRVRARAGAAVDVLRAVRPRARDRRRAVLARLLGPAARSSSRGAPSGRRPATARSTRWSGISHGREWLVGDAMTLADIALYAYTHVAGRGRLRARALPGDPARGSTASRRSPGTSDRRVGARRSSAQARRAAGVQRAPACRAAASRSSGRAAGARVERRDRAPHAAAAALDTRGSRPRRARAAGPRARCGFPCVRSARTGARYAP